MSRDSSRYAIYFAPDRRSRLWRFGCGVIGYDAEKGANLPFLTTAGLSVADWAALTEDPRRYGFHATLKAPFYLAGETTEAAFLSRVEALAISLPIVRFDGLQVSTISRFIALTPVGDVTAMTSLCAEVVECLDDLRAPLTEADRARRLARSLSDRQRHYLDRFGYPYVREEFRFHMTLTGGIAPESMEAIRGHLECCKNQALVEEPVIVDALTVFRQSTRDQRFRVIARFPLTSSIAVDAAIHR